MIYLLEKTFTLKATEPELVALKKALHIANIPNNEPPAYALPDLTEAEYKTLRNFLSELHTLTD